METAARPNGAVQPLRGTKDDLPPPLDFDKESQDLGSFTSDDFEIDMNCSLPPGVSYRRLQLDTNPLAIDLVVDDGGDDDDDDDADNEDDNGDGIRTKGGSGYAGSLYPRVSPTHRVEHPYENGLHDDATM